jgi:hypothetical protein
MSIDLIEKSASVHFDLRASPLWLAWLRALARADHRSASETIEHALFKYAQTIGFPDPPPDRLQSPHQLAWWREVFLPAEKNGSLNIDYPDRQS